MIKILKLYLDFCIICLIAEGLINFRLMKHRKTFSTHTELILTLTNSFIPILNVVILLSNLRNIFASEDKIKALALVQDTIQIQSEEMM